MQKYSLITGSAGLLGEYHAKGLLEIGYNLILTDLDLIKLKKLKAKLNTKYENNKIKIYKMDVTSEKSIKQVLSKINNLGGVVDNLINNAAIDAKIKTGKNIKFENLKLEQWNKEISVGLTGTMLCSKIFGSEMVKKKN